ncbi:GNAT family N-acetyltransferase [Dehalococcoidia bacterium]|nr:GNAT family N-acetyltransferase [Dehalococcoidia bacterium]
MKFKPVQLPEKKGSDRKHSPAVRRLSDRSEILSYLERERSCCAAAIAHLEPDLWAISKFFVAIHHETFALCLISRSMSPRFIMTLGNEAVLNCLLGSISLPDEAFITCRPKHLDAIERHYDLEWHRLMKRMATVRETFSPLGEEAIQLTAAQVKEANNLCRVWSLESGVWSPPPHTPDSRLSTLDSRLVGKGVFYGIYRDGRLVAAAGAHLISPTYGIAYLEDVLVHPAYRNQGLDTICISAVAADLFDYCTEVVIGVEPQNLPAVKAYAGLGFRDDCLIVEAMGRRHSFVGAIITNLWKQFRWNPKYEERTEPYG